VQSEVRNLQSNPVTPPVTSADRATDKLPAWYPKWARELADLYFSRTTCVFVVHGNVHDWIRVSGDEGEDAYCSLTEFFALQVFGKWDIILQYDLSQGLKAQAGDSVERLRTMVQFLSARWGEPAGWAREPDKVLLLLDSLVERTLIDDDAARKSIAILFNYAQFLVSAGDLDELARGQAARLVRFLSWAQNPLIRRANIAFLLITDKLGEINERLVQSPHLATIEIPLPDRTERLRFIKSKSKQWSLPQMSEFSDEQLADMSNGLSLVNLDVLLSPVAHLDRRLDIARFRELKKAMIERQCADLIEFIEPSNTLDLMVGQEAAKQRLADDAALIAHGQLDTAPMGYLVCGPVGTGKTFLAECYAGSIGIPCVVLKNFRSKYVGETEGNLQQVLTVLRSLGPVVVVVDEADAALGNRQAEGDSGTSARVFSMIASQMGDTRYRGQIIWMLLTSRPDLLPIDLKRQGRAEVHIPLFYPQEPAEIRTMIEVMARKNKVKLAAGAVPEVLVGHRLSGADIESIILAAKRRAAAAKHVASTGPNGDGAGGVEITAADLEESLAEFIPSAQGLEKELQEIAAVLECTQLSFLPSVWREKLAVPGARAALQERLVALRQMLSE
jgi:ATPase family associated with various cellular activities (AAA)